MFNKKTVIVLGAGASAHLGFSTGEKLVENLCKTQLKCHEKVKKEDLEKVLTPREHNLDEIWNKINEYKWIDENGNISLSYKANIATLKPASCRAIITELFEKKETEFIEKRDEFTRRLSQIDPLMIDLFLSHNRDVIDIGKILLTHEMLRKEDIEVFEQPIRNEDGKIMKNWYRFLLDALTTGCNVPEDLLKNNENLTIVIFNYDVSLEYYLEHRIKQIELFKDVADKFLNKLNIIHVYGQLGKYKWQNTEFYDSGEDWVIREGEEAYGFLKNDKPEAPEPSTYDKLKKYSALIQIIGNEKWNPAGQTAQDEPLNTTLKKAHLFDFLSTFTRPIEITRTYTNSLWSILLQNNYIKTTGERTEEKSLIIASIKKIEGLDDNFLKTNISGDIATEDLKRFLFLPYHIKEIRSQLQKTDNLFLLGFGFYPENIKLIGLDKTLNWARTGKKLFYTNYGDHQRIETRLNAHCRIQEKRKSTNSVEDALSKDFDL